MPKKIRDLKRMLREAGFAERPGRGSHTVWSHPNLKENVTVAGHDGDDAKPYLVKQVKQAIRAAEKKG